MILLYMLLYMVLIVIMIIYGYLLFFITTIILIIPEAVVRWGRRGGVGVVPDMIYAIIN